MTFDEIFQQYIAQGFTKPTAGVSGIETLMPTQAMPIAPIPVIEPSGDRDNINNINNIRSIDPNSFDYESAAYGVGPTFQGTIASLKDLYSQLPTPLNLAIAGFKGIGSLVNNFQNPYKDITGNLNQQTQDAINRDIARDMQASNQANKTGGYQAGYSSDFMGGGGGGGNTGGSPGSSGPGGSDSMGSF